MNWLRTLRRISELLTPQERTRGLIVTALMLVQAIFETAGVASIMPFLSVLGNPDLVERDARLAWLYDRGGFDSRTAFLQALAVGSFLLIILSAALRIGTTYVTTRYVQMRRYSIAARLLQAYLRQPYEFFLNRNSADLSKGVLSEVDAVVDKVISPAMQLVSYGLVAIVLGGLLVIIDPLLALGAILIVAGAYGSIYLGVRGGLGRIGKNRILANLERFQAASEAFGGIKDLKVLGREVAYLSRFRKPAARYARYQYIQMTVSLAPKYLVEAIGVGGILALALLLMATRGDLGVVLPVLGIYAFGGYRLLPAAQNIYNSVSTLRFGVPALDAMIFDFAGDSPGLPPERPDTTVLHPRRSIRFENVSFAYPGAKDYALRAVTLRIPAHSSIGLVGETGAGKTTAVDLILGLLRPSSGAIMVDDMALEDQHIRPWQRGIGYVPQSIYLADASVAENIAFGIEPADIDYSAVRRAAEIANIHDFISTDLPAGYETEVGERGVRLSGGQRQRIGIARALYEDPPVLVLDEATSALDAATERAVMDAVDRLIGKKTIIIIAHRLSTVLRCDQIAVFDRGRLVAAGPPGELGQTCAAFRRLASV